MKIKDFIGGIAHAHFGGMFVVGHAGARPVMVHYTPWFESLPYSGCWGWHWTMASTNTSIVPDNNINASPHMLEPKTVSQFERGLKHAVQNARKIGQTDEIGTRTGRSRMLPPRFYLGEIR